MDIDPQEMAIYRFDFQRLVIALAEALGFESRLDWSDGDAAWRIGTDRPMAGVSVPVYLQTLSMRDAVRYATDDSDGPFVLIRWQDERLSDDVRYWLQRRDVLLLTLAELASIDERGEVTIAVAAQKELDAFRRQQLPNTDAGQPGIRFPTPAGTRWSQVAIQFKSDEAVQVSVGDVSQIYNFTQMGFVDARNGRPTLQWELLRMMAAERGIYTWHSPGACRKNKKRREVLTKKLREFFGVEGDPIELTDDKKGYRTVFKLTPQGD